MLELLRAEISQRRMKPASVVDLLDEVRKMPDDIVEGFERHRVDRLHLQGFQQAFGLALSYGLPLRPIEPIRPLALSASR